MTKTLVGTYPGGEDRPPPMRRQPEPRTSVRQYFREVRDEMRQVAWPTRPEVTNYTSIVGTVLVLMITLIFGLNLTFSHAILWLYQK